MYDQLSDAELARKALTGDDEAARHFDRLWRPRLFDVCFRILHNHQDAEDCVQVALWSAICKIDQFDSRRPFTPWIHRIACNTATTVARKRRSSRMVLDEPFDRKDESPSADHNIINEEEIHAMKESLALLTKDLRDVITLCKMEEYSLNQAGQFLGVPKQTVNSRLRRAIDELRMLMKEGL